MLDSHGVVVVIPTMAGEEEEDREVDLVVPLATEVDMEEVVISLVLEDLVDLVDLVAEDLGDLVAEGPEEKAANVLHSAKAFHCLLPM